FAAGETADVTRQGARRCHGTCAPCACPVPGCPVPGRQDISGGRPPPPGPAEQRPPPPPPAQRAAPPPSGGLRPPARDAPPEAALEVADRPRADPRRLGQFLLRQPGPSPEPPQQCGETQLSLRHRFPATLPPGLPPTVAGHAAGQQTLGVKTIGGAASSRPGA